MDEKATKRVLVSGCFDLLHAGHIAFLEEAARHGELHVRVGSDENIVQLKGRPPMFSEEERVFVLAHLACVTDARVASGRGMLDFAPDLEAMHPDAFIVNEDGHTEGKAELCRRLGVEYIVLRRIPARDFAPRSSTDTKGRLRLPYRACIAGGWMDQPWVSAVLPGSVVTVGLEPTIEFSDRAGMATSSRKVAEWMWGNRFPAGDPERIARILFAVENPPGTAYVSGSQDAIGLVFPGINRLDYAGGFWPERIESIRDPEIIDWLEGIIHFVPLAPRPDGYDPLVVRDLSPEAVGVLAPAGRACWDAIVRRDIEGLGRALSLTAEGWKRILPLTIPSDVDATLARYGDRPGAVPSGCGGGYIIVVSDRPVDGSFRVKIRRDGE
ncbi:MAG: adenylyltransferase/cytidyltransferase family protein [Planctomycetes bacterium]|nr:adenylyltransferase/cytidyltransferase family protein [Planctomycetota bacterium]